MIYPVFVLTLLYFLSSSWVWSVIDALVEDLTYSRYPLPSDGNLKISEQIQAHNLSFQDHNVTTEDGYINNIWHVWDPTVQPLRKANGEKKVLFFQHGLIDIAGTWFFNTEELSIPTHLARQGYDIWLGNNRGTVFSFHHVNLTVDDPAYWNYSFDEMGRYDLPANIDFVLAQTNASQVSYLGHSQGTLQFWIANTLYSDLGSKIDKMVAFAPVMYMTHQSSLLINHAVRTGADHLLLNLFDELFWLQNGYSRLYSAIWNWAPTVLTFIPRTCWVFVQGLVGLDEFSHMSPERMPMMARNDVGGASTKDIKHFMQYIRTGVFADYEGREYKKEALKTNLANTDIMLLGGNNDAFSQPLDTDKLEALLPDTRVTRIRYLDYNHLDYLWGNDVGESVNQRVYDFINK